MPELRTTDLCDAHGNAVRIIAPMFQDYGGRSLFHGPVSTVQTFEDNSRVREALAEPGEGRVLVVDGGGSMRCALLGDNLARMGYDNGWAGVVVYGCVRDAAELGAIPLPVKGLNTHPRRSEKRGEGERDVPVSFGGISIRPGEYLYADEDGVIMADEPLELPA